MFCPNCKSEYIDGIVECPDCTIPLVDTPHDNKSNSHPGKYLNDLEEWGTNQYNPGHWTGGNIPPHIKVLNKLGNKTIGIAALII